MNAEMLITDKFLSPPWKAFLKEEIATASFSNLSRAVFNAYEHQTIYPPINCLFNAFNACPPENLKAVIIGQDPYHGPSQANGFAFSVHPGTKLPPSLRNILKELSTDLPGFQMPITGDLTPWAKQGVLLMNATLTVKASEPGSHQRLGWEDFTDSIIQKLSLRKTHLVFLLWGQFAQSKAAYIDENKHLVLMAAHPSPLARGGFFGNHHFSLTNTYLASHQVEPIDWSLI